MTGDARDEGRWPTFLVIGAARSGTTAIHMYLEAHPDIRIPTTKEPSFFTLRVLDVDMSTPESRVVWAGAIFDEAEYRACFADPPGRFARAYGECSPVYLPVEETAAAIHAVVPGAWLIAMLRDPVDRAVSHHAHNRSIGIEPHANFAEALAADDATGGWQYARQGLYAQQLSRYLELFDREQLLLVDHAELSADPKGTLARIFDHIGVEQLDPFPEIPRMLATSPDPVPGPVRAALAARLTHDTRRLIEELGFDPARAWSTAPPDLKPGS